MKKNLFTIIIALCIPFIYNDLQAQVTIGTEIEPDSGALLDLKEGANGESTKGLLLPRVNLDNLASPSPLVTHVKGIIVYNLKTTNQLTPGLYKNDGTQWVRMELPDNGEEDQVLEIDPITLAPKWVTKYVAPEDLGSYALTKSEAFRFTDGAILTTNFTGTEYYEGDDLYDGTWTPIIETIEIDNVTEADNKLIIFLQTTLLQPGYASGSLSYAGAVFLNGELSGVRVSVISSTAGTGGVASKTETLFFVLENLPTNTNTIDIAFKRRTASGGGVNALHIGQSLNYNGVINAGSTSLSYEFYERK